MTNIIKNIIIKNILPIDEECPLSVKKEIEIDNKKVSLCNYNIICHKNENCIFLEFDDTFEELSVKRKTQLYSYPICVNNNEVATSFKL